MCQWVERQALEDMVGYAQGTIKGRYGNDIEKHIVKPTSSAWGGDPFVRGAYSAALPGRAGARKDLAAAIDGKLFFAGEATHAITPVTTYGAIDSGMRAANEIVALVRAAS